MYKNIEIDHIFTIVNQGFEHNLSEELNSQIKLKRTHTGQGTSARFLPFERNYLEFIWLSNLEESKGNQLKLYKRFMANQCPFGIAFPGKIEDEFKNDFIEYNPSYSIGSTKILIHRSHFEDFSIPMLFVMDLGVEHSALYPKNNPYFDKSYLHLGGFEKVSLTLKEYSKTLENFPTLIQKTGDLFKLEIAGAKGPELSEFNIDFN